MPWFSLKLNRHQEATTGDKESWQFSDPGRRHDLPTAREGSSAGFIADLPQRKTGDMLPTRCVESKMFIVQLPSYADESIYNLIQKDIAVPPR